MFSGQIIWRVIDNRRVPLGEPLATGLVTNSDRIFVSFISTTSVSGEMLSGAAKLKAYDTNGDTLWSRSIGGARSITRMMATNDTVSVDGSFSSSYYLLDAQNGEIINAALKDNGNFVWFVDGNVRYEQTKEFLLQAVNITTESAIWQYSINAPVYLPPIFSTDYIIVRTNEAHFYGTVIVLNRETGKTVWEHADILSNVVIDQQRVYFLTKDMQLIGADIYTGEVLVSASFSPNEAIDPVNNVYQIVANNNKIVIYFGGTHQLSAFNY